MRPGRLARRLLRALHDGKAGALGQRAMHRAFAGDLNHAFALPWIEVDPQTFEVRADGKLLMC